MGTTLVGAVVKGNEMTVVNVGDSRAYHITSEGIRKVTRDHSVVETLVQRGTLTPEEARIHPQKNLITRALGTSITVTADVFAVSFQEGDQLLLCSDGLINEMTDEEIFHEVSKGEPADQCCKRLIEIALSREASDNVTVLLFQHTSKE